MNNHSVNTDMLFVHKQWDKTVFEHKLDTGSIVMMPKPPGGQQLSSYIRYLKSRGVNVLVSLLQYEENVSHSLVNEASECESEGIDFINFPIKDHSVPQFILPYNQLIIQLVQKIQKGMNVGIHCYAGIGRTGLIASSILIKMGVQIDMSMLELSRTRGLRVPETLEQISWLHRHVDQLAQNK